MPVSAPSSSKAALSTRLPCTVAPSTGCQCWQNNSQSRYSYFQIYCASHAHLQGCNMGTALTRLRVLPWQSLFSFVQQTQPLYCQGGASEGLYNATPKMTWGPNPVTPLLSVTDGATVQRNTKISRIWCGYSVHGSEMQTTWQFWGWFAAAGSLYYYIIILFSCDRADKRAALTGLNFPVSSVTSWELISSPHKDLWSSSLAFCTRGTAILNYFVKHHVVFFILLLDPFQNYSQKIINNNLFNIRGKIFAWYFFHSDRH